jgi:peptidoglycan/xylan/chitin deacetylase (PgdA/CDA1 family)
MISAALTLLALTLAADVPLLGVGRVATDEPVVALTFDACSTQDQANGFDRPVFDILKKEQIPVTVFVSGRWLEFHRDEARELAAEPWVEFGNHSYSHPHMTAVPQPRLLDEIARTEELIAQLGRHSVAFRPPAGIFDMRTLRAAAERSLPTVLWDVVSGDAGGHVPAPMMVSSVSQTVQNGSIVIFHINGRGPYTHNALPEIIKNLRDRGFRFVRLSELLAVPGGRPIPSRKYAAPKNVKASAGSEG